MRIFLDSSVIIAALLSETGASAKIILLGEADLLELYITKEIIDEINQVLERKLPEIKVLFNKLIKKKIFVISKNAKPSLTKKAKAWISDPKDAKILAGAVEAKVDFLLTLDINDFIKDVRVAKKSGLNITTPGDFLQNNLKSGLIK